MNPSVETYDALSCGGRFRNAFLGRVPGLDVTTDRESALARLRQTHETMRHTLGFGDRLLATARQVHGNRVARVDAATPFPVEEADALITDDPRLCLGIYVADCGAIYAVDPVTGGIGLAHSGKKGTELRILPAMVAAMQSAFGSDPASLVVLLSPCIRPPHYEVDFAAEILRQGRDAGVGTVVDTGACTASDPQRYYSYRMEKGRTGRMLALLARE